MKANKPTILWCVLSSNGHFWWRETLAYTRKDAIERFVNGSAYGWTYWRKRKGFKCIKVSVTITPQS